MALRGGNTIRRGEVGEKQENKHPMVANFTQGLADSFLEKSKTVGGGVEGRPEVWEVPSWASASLCESA